MINSKNPFYDATLKSRHRSSKIFKFFALSSLILSISFLMIFIFDITSKAIPAFKQTYIQIEVDYSKGEKSGRRAVAKEYRKIISRAWIRDIPRVIKINSELKGQKVTVWALADDQVDQYIKGHNYNLKDKDRELVDKLNGESRVELHFNTLFFSNGDSKIPEYSGVSSAVVGTIFTMFMTMLFAFPIGVMTAIYLEEFSEDNKFTQFIEININNLAAIPSILFGLLGLSIFINFFGLPRSSPLVGGLTLALMTLPIIIVSSRAALRSVPDSIREAGYGLGLNKIQVVKDHVLPLASPGIMTGSIIGLAQAMGETAPLIIVGMIAFIPDAPTSIMEASTVMPAQIFTWAGMPEGAYVERTAAAILLLLGILLSLNAVAIYLRKKFEVKW